MLALPALQGEAVAGSIIASALAGKAQHEVEDVFEIHLRMGNVPAFLRTPVKVPVATVGHIGAVFVLPDVLAVGTDDDFFRVPLTPGLAQRVADLSGAMLPTRALSIAIWECATVKLSPRPMGAPYDETMCSPERFWAHHVSIEEQRRELGARLGALVAGHKKDVVVTPLLASRPDRVAIYGWHTLSGAPIQGLNASSHSSAYRDYSHGIRLVDRMMDVDGAPASLPQILNDPNLHRMVSDEGPSRIWRYAP